jgi:hypothetical protein
MAYARVGGWKPEKALEVEPYVLTFGVVDLDVEVEVEKGKWE